MTAPKGMVKMAVMYRQGRIKHTYWMSIPASGPRTHVNIHWLGGPPGPVRSHIPHVRLSSTVYR